MLFDSYLKIVVVFILLVSTTTTPKRLEQMTWLILLACGYIAFRAVFDYARGVNLVEDGRVAGAVGGIFGELFAVPLVGGERARDQIARGDQEDHYTCQ